MTSFNFFVVIAALLTAGLARSLENDFKYYFVGLCLGISLMITSFIFWKLDQRVRHLIKHAEQALKDIEQRCIREGCADTWTYVALFSNEEEKTDRLQARQSPWKFWRLHLTYSRCFGAVYLVFALLGLFGAVAAAVRWKVG